jgi:competence protein ComEC
VLVTFIIKNKFSKYLQILATITFFILGAFALGSQKSSYKYIFKKIENQNLEITATVSDKRVLPQKTWHDMAEVLSLDVACDESVQMDSTSSPRTDSSRPVRPNFSLLCYSKFKTHAQVGDVIKLSNIKIKKSKSLSLSGNTSYQKYLYKDGFLSAVFLTKKQKLTIIERPNACLQRWLWNLKMRIYGELQEKMHSHAFTYFALIFLGNTQQLEITQMRETFNCWGLSHYLARSGLHVVLFILIWTFLLRFIPIGLNWKRFFLIMLCVIYKSLSWSSIPFIRAFYAFLLIENGKIFNFQTDFLHLLSIICTMVLLFNPLQLFFLDFQLSFGLTFALSWALRYF